MFPPSSRSPLPPPEPWAGAPRRPLHERIVETLRYLSDEVDTRRVGGLGEAQAAGYVAGRLRRADYTAAVQSFRAGVGERPVLLLITLLGALGGGAAALGSGPLPVAAGGALLLVALLLLAVELGAPGFRAGSLRHLFKGKLSQSVVAARAAGTRQARWRVLILAPLDGPPLVALSRVGLLLLIAALGLSLGAAIIALITALPAARWLSALGAATLLGLAGWIAVRRATPAFVPAVHGAGELTTLLMIAEELAPLKQVEVWPVALGGGAIGHESVRALIERYPFSPADTWVINLHNITAGQPVFVTREGMLREHRSASALRGLASDTDAADLTIDAEPRRLRERTLVQPLLREGFRAITVSSHLDHAPFTSPDAQTIARCVRLVVGMINGLDA